MINNSRLPLFYLIIPQIYIYVVTIGNYEKLAAIAEKNNRAKGRELAGMIDKRHKEVISSKNWDE